VDATGFKGKEMFDSFGPLYHDVVGRNKLVDVNCWVVYLPMLLLRGRVETRVVDIRGRAFLDVCYLFVAGGHSVCC
jgi:hypothetical protein